MSESVTSGFRSAKEIFFEAQEKHRPQERAAFLDGACRGSPEQRAKVEALLANHFQTDEFMQRPAMEASGPSLAELPAVEPRAAMVGRYKLLEKIGEGGFGEVWMAEQREPVKRRVALKIIKPGMDSRQVVARFEAERQALALMDHPNIAKIFDAGSTGEQADVRRQRAEGRERTAPRPDHGLLPSAFDILPSAYGRPYFVMELVRGVKITEYCDQNQLPNRERLGLFIKVCQAIQHAHQKGIIHRDIKPSNILVTRHDGVPVPKVIDFGIAKATQQELTDKTVFTQFQQFIGTPAYISPEQAEMSGLDIDTRADIYSLGVLLYELLVGQTPFDAQEMLKGGLDALRRIVCEREPLRPSTKLNLLSGEARTTAAKCRQTDLGRLVHQLEGDLDWIVMKCLEKDRSRRYDTAHGLAMDIQRYLANEPVVARPPSTAYKIKKAWQRNRLVFTAAAVVVLALAGLMVSVAVFSVLFGRQQQRTAATLRSSLAGEFLRRGQSLCLEGKVTEGLHWLVRSLEQVPADQTNLIAVIRQNLGGWTLVRNRPLSVIYQKALIYAVAYSPVEDRVVLGGMENCTQLYSATTGEPMGPAMPHDSTVGQTVFSPDGRFIASRDTKAWLWLATDGRPAFPSLGPTQGVTSVAFSPDSRRLLIATSDGTAQQWSVETGQALGPPLTHRAAVRSACFSPDGRWIATGSSDQTARLWSAQTSEPAGPSLRHEEALSQLAFSPDGRILATLGTNRTVWLWSVRDGDLIAPPIRHNGVVKAMAFSPDSQHLLTGSEDGSARLWNLVGEPIGSPMRHEGGVLAVTFTPDGQRVLTANILGEASVWSAQTGEPTGLVVKHRMWNVDYSPDGQCFLTAGRDGLVKFWSAATGEPWGQPLIHSADVRAAVFSHDGRNVATACFDKTARVWSVATRQPIGEPFVHPKIVEDIAFSPDDTRLVTAGSDGRALVWSVASGQCALPPLEHRSAVLGAVFSPDGKRILTGSRDTTARLWDAATGQPVGPPMQHPDWVEEVAFSPDGQTILTGSNDGRARFWSASTGQLLGPPVLNHGPLMDVQFSPDGRRAIASSQAKAFWVPQGPTFRGARIWRLPEPFAGRIETANQWVESLTGMSLDDRGVLSWLETAVWRERQREFEQPGPVK